MKTFVASVDALDVWSQVGSAVYKPGDTVSSTVAGGKVVVGVRNPIGKAAVRSHALVQQACPLTLSQSGFADLTYGYSQGNAALFTMRNDGLSEIRALSLGFDQGEGQFSLGALSKTVLAPGEEATFTVTAKTGLAAGSIPWQDSRIRAGNADGRFVRLRAESRGARHLTRCALRGGCVQAWHCRPHVHGQGADVGRRMVCEGGRRRARVGRCCGVVSKQRERRLGEQCKCADGCCVGQERKCEGLVQRAVWDSVFGGAC